MAIRPLVLLPDSRLKLPSEPVTDRDSALRQLVNDMFATMYDAPGIGLAAIQVGVPRRVVTLDLGRTEHDRAPQVFLNPEIIWSSAEMGVYEEGCLSIPDYYAEVERPASVHVRYMDLDGTMKVVEADGLLATCLQHEIDHLNGILFIDHLSRLKRERVTRKFAKAAREREAERREEQQRNAQGRTTADAPTADRTRPRETS